MSLLLLKNLLHNKISTYKGSPCKNSLGNKAVVYKVKPCNKPCRQAWKRGLVLGAVMLAVAAGALLRGAPVATAATSSTINFQARLMTAAGSIVPDGNYNVEFKIYNASSSSGSSQGSCSGDSHCEWVETRTGANVVRVADGYLTVNLGSVTAFPSTMPWDQQLWLTMNIGGTNASPTWDGEMNPRIQLTALPYSFYAGTAFQIQNSSYATLLTTSGNQISLPNATSSSSALTFGGDTTADLYRSASGTLKTDGNLNIAGNISGAGTINLTGSGTSSLMGPLGIGVVNPQGALTIANSAWINAVNSAGTGNINILSVNSSNQIQLGAALAVDGGIVLPTDAGQVTFSDLPIDSSAAAGTPESYTMRVGSTNALTVYGESDGAGGVQNVRIAIGGSITPGYTLDVGGDVNTSGVYRVGGVQICSSTGCTAASGSGYYIQNGTSQQANSNFNISGNGTIGTNLNVTGTATVGDIATADLHTYSLSRTLPTTVNNEVDIGSFAFTNGGGSLDISIISPNSGFSVAKHYIVPIQYNQTAGAWETVLPISDTGGYNSNNFDLNINISNGTTSLRILRTAGSTAGTAYVEIVQTGKASDSFTSSTATSAVSAPTSFYSNSVIDQTLGAVGINMQPSSGGGALQLAAGTTSASGITFGGDTNLYRGAANTLQTDDKVVLNGGSQSLQIGTTGCNNFYIGNTTDGINRCNNQFQFVTTQTQGFNFSGGNVGIGTTNPGATLEVNGSIKLTGSNGVLQKTASGNDWYLQNSHLDSSYGVWVNSTTGQDRLYGMDATSSNGLSLYSNGSADFNILNNGLVGIGLVPTTSGATLQVNGSISATSQIGFTNTGNANQAISLSMVVTSAVSANQVVIIDTVNPGQVTTTSAGNMGTVFGIATTSNSTGVAQPIVTSGVYQVMADSNQVNVGDTLVTSSTTTGDVASTTAPSVGAVLGQALSAKSAGSPGLIWVKLNPGTGSGDYTPVGTISAIGSTTVPSGWLAADGSSISRSAYPSLFNALNPSQGTATISLASPGVVSMSGDTGLNNGDHVFLETTGSLPTGLSADTMYCAENVTSNGLAFNLAPYTASTYNSDGATNNQCGSNINTSGSQSGTVTVYFSPYGVADSTHFNLPDLRGRVAVGYSSGGKQEVSNLGNAEGLTASLRNISDYHTFLEGGTSGSGLSAPSGGSYTNPPYVYGNTSGDTNNLNKPSYETVNYMIKAGASVALAASNSFIQNGTSVQTANMNIQGSGIGNVVAVIQGASGQTADILDVKDNSNNKLLAVDAGGNLYIKGSIGFANTGNANQAFTINENITGSVTAGDVVVIDTANAGYVKDSSSANSTQVVGIATKTQTGGSEPIVISGIYQVNVGSNTPNIGDYLVTDSNTGEAQSSTSPSGGIVGQAMSTASSNKVWALIKPASGTGGSGGSSVVGVQTYTSGSGTFTLPANVTALQVEIVGGGGGGGPGNSYGGGGGGGAGGYARKFISSPSASYSYAVGAGGVPWGGGGHTSGGTTTFGTLTATGGSDAGGGTAPTVSTGGNGSGGDFNTGGGSGTSPVSNYYGMAGGEGGASYFGGGGAGGDYGAAGSAGAAYGSGGGGAGGIGSSSLAGGYGASGAIIITEYGSSLQGGAGIQNGTTLQSNANFNIQSASAGSVTATIHGTTGQTADVLDVQTATNANLLSVSSAGNVSVAGNLNVTGTIGFNNVGNANQGLTINENITGSVTAGDVVVIDTSNAGYVKDSTSANSTQIVGIATVTQTGGSEPIIVSGIYQVNVTGSVNIGDYLVTSSTTGAAQDTTSPTGGIVGQALSTASSGKAWAIIKPASGTGSSGSSSTVPTVHAYATSVTAVATSTWTTIPLGGETFDTDSMHSTATNPSRITFNTAGTYTLTASVDYSESGSGAGLGRRMYQLIKNGSTVVAFGVSKPGSYGDTNPTLAVTSQFSAGDYVELQAFQDSGYSMNVASGDPNTSVSAVEEGVGSSGGSGDGSSIMGVQTLTSGSGTFTTPLGVTSMMVEIVGGGGGGGGASSSYHYGAGGGSGGYGRVFISSPSSSYSYTVGSGGTAGGAGGGTGGGGSSTTFGTLTANGGGGGGGNVGQGNYGGSPASVGSGGDINLPGNSPPPTGGAGSPGASSYFGGGGRANYDSNGVSGTDGGGGGGGDGYSASRSGGTGGSGLIVITEYSSSLQGGTGSDIQNGTTLQTNANFNIQSASANSVTATIHGTTGQSADILDVQNSSNVNLLSVDPNGNTFVAGDLNVGGTIGFSNVGNQNQGISLNMVVTSSVTAGDVVVVDTTAAGQVTDSTTANSTKVFGVATTTNSAGVSQPIIVSGIYQVNVDTAAVNIGDYLVTSSTAGRATDSTSPSGGVIGQALSSKSAGSNGTVWARINPGNGAGGSGSSTNYGLMESDFTQTGTLTTGIAPGHQLATVGNNIYAFGGGDNSPTQAIYTATTSNPNTWTSTGANLPSNLSMSSLAVIGSNIYLFGGYNGTSGTNAIYTASTSSPTTWTTAGSTLPGNLYSSQLAIIGNYIYLFGGVTGSWGSGLTNVIYRAPVSNPLSWTNMSLPANGSYTTPGSGISYGTIAVIGNYVYIFGTYNGSGPVNASYRAPVSNPLTGWQTFSNNLPSSIDGSSLAIVGNYIYLFGGYNGSSYSNVIYRAPVSNPSSGWVNMSPVVVPASLDSISSFIAGNALYLLGGYNGSSASTAIYSAPIFNGSPDVSANPSWITDSNYSSGGGSGTSSQTTNNNYQLDYQQIISGVSITGTSEGSAITTITGHSITLNGSTPIELEVGLPSYQGNSGCNVSIYLAQDGIDQGLAAFFTVPGNGYLVDPQIAPLFLTPAAGSHTYSVKASDSCGNGVFQAGAGGSGARVPAFLRVTLANPQLQGGAGIQNGTTVQTGNFNLQSSSQTSVTGILKGATSQSADVFEVQDASSNILFNVGPTGNVSVAGNLSVGGTIGFSNIGNANQIMTVNEPVTTAVNQYDVVVIDTNNAGQVTTTTLANSTKVFGVATKTSGTAGASQPIAISGIYQVNVDTAAVNVGDYLVTSGTAGLATDSQYPSGGVIGQAMSAKSAGSNGTVWVRLNPGNGAGGSGSGSNSYGLMESDWTDTGAALPGAAGDAQSVTVGNNIYLFGGVASSPKNTIYTASVSNPTSWSDTHITLPVTLYDSQAAIIGSYVYLFGGVANGAYSQSIYYESLTNLTNNVNGWSTATNALPGAIAASQLAIIGSNIYLFGGFNGSSYLQSIYTTSIANPTSSWTTAAGTIPVPLAFSQVAVIGNYVYLFGGHLSSGRSSAVYRAPVSNPAGVSNSWVTTSGTIGDAMNSSNLAIVGNYIYLLGGQDGSGYMASIYRAPINNPAGDWAFSNAGLPVALGVSQPVIVGNAIYLIGGQATSGGTGEIYSAPIYNGSPDLSSNPSWKVDSNASSGGGSGTSSQTANNNTELAYVSSATTANLSTTDQTVISATPITTDGNTPINIHFYAGAQINTVTMYVTLWDGSTNLGTIATDGENSGTLLNVVNTDTRLIPSAGSHTYSIHAYTGSGAAYLIGNGGTNMPMYIRITLANPQLQGGSGIANGTTTQTGNFNLQSANGNNPTAVIQGASSQSADILDVKDGSGNIAFSVSPTDNAYILGSLGIGSTAGANIKLQASSSSNVAAIGLFNGPTTGVRIGANSFGGQIEGIDNTGYGSYQSLYIGGSDLRFSISGVEQARLTSSGNLGIGTTSPSRRLSVLNASGNTGSLTLANSDYVYGSTGTSLGINSGAASGNTYYRINVFNNGESGATGNLVLQDQGGNVGIGETPSLFKLQTAGSIVSDQGSNLYVGLGCSAGGSASPTTYGCMWLDSTTHDLNIQALSGGVAWRNTIINASGGNVGVGTTSPGAKLTVQATDMTTFQNNSLGGILLQGGSYVANDVNSIDFKPSNYNTPFARIGMQETANGSYLIFGTSNNYNSGITNSALTIDYNGNATFSGNVTVNGNLVNHGGYVIGSPSQPGMWMQGGFGTTNSSGYLDITFNTAFPNGVQAISVTGAWMGADTYYYSYGNVTKTGFRAYSPAGSEAFSWMAIGY